MRYRVAKASEYLVISGCGVKDLKLSKKGWILPGQSCTVFDVTPVNYTFEVQAMSAEKLPFILPAVFTIGPKVEDEAALLKYARLISPHDKLSHHVKELVQGVIEGETRVLAASMTMEEIFKGTKQFKKEVFEKVQLELDQFGLLIYNANVKQLVDVVGHEYFSYLGQKTQMEAANQAKIDVAEAKMKGDTGAKEREGLTLQNAAKVDAETRIYAKQQAGFGRQQELKVEAETKIFENEREAEVSEANTVLATKKATWVQQAQIADIEAAKNAAIREAELQREVERRNALTETERIRAKILTKATVEYETKVQESNAEFYQKQKETDAVLYEKQNEAEAKKLAADAAFYTKQKEAEAQLYAKKREAEGLMAMAEAHAYHVKTLLEAFRGNYMAFRDYMMLDKNVYQDMAKFNAEAIKGLNPKVSVWTTGSGQAAEGIEGSNGAMQQISGIYKMIPPLFTTVKEQTVLKKDLKSREEQELSSTCRQQFESYHGRNGYTHAPHKLAQTPSQKEIDCDLTNVRAQTIHLNQCKRCRIIAPSRGTRFYSMAKVYEREWALK